MHTHTAFCLILFINSRTNSKLKTLKFIFFLLWSKMLNFSAKLAIMWSRDRSYSLRPCVYSRWGYAKGLSLSLSLSLSLCPSLSLSHVCFCIAIVIVLIYFPS